MSRIPIVPRDQLEGHQLKSYDKISEINEKSFGDNGALFKYKDEQGGLLGPFAFALAEPVSGDGFMDLFTQVSKISLPAKAKETAILAVGGTYKADYELYAHSAAAKKAGLSERQIKSIIAHEKPDDLDAACSAAYDAAVYLSSKPGALPADMWQALNKELGSEGTIGIIHFIGLYAYTCVMLNATDVKVPA